MADRPAHADTHTGAPTLAVPAGRAARLASLGWMAAGVAGCIWAVTSWAHNDFGPILYDSVLRVLVPSLTAIAVAAQLAATAFLTSLLTIRR